VHKALSGKPKIQIWVNFGGSFKGRFWYTYFTAIWSILGHLVNFVAIWYIFVAFGIFYGHLVHFSPFWYVSTEKNLATLIYN
jgi:hypothetical protein